LAEFNYWMKMTVRTCHNPDWAPLASTESIDCVCWLYQKAVWQ